VNLPDVSRLRALWTQLNSGSPTAGADCVPVTEENLITWASRGKVGPDMQSPARDPQSVASWVRFLRRITGRSTGAFMIRSDGYDSLASSEVRKAFIANGVTPPTIDYRYGMEFSELHKWLAASTDRAALVAIHYGVARAAGCPVGSQTFAGGHAVMFIGAQRKRVRVWNHYRRFWHTVVGDPLFDGRRKPLSLKRYPKGWKVTRTYPYRRAAAMFGTALDGSPRPIGPGRCVAILVERH
jgi:hypothetical protein